MTVKEFEIQYALGVLSEDTKLDLAGNPRTPKGILTRLFISSDEYGTIRDMIADNPNTTKKVLAELSTDADVLVRWRVADNLNTSQKILIKLMLDKNWGVRFNAKLNIDGECHDTIRARYGSNVR